MNKWIIMCIVALACAGILAISATIVGAIFQDGLRSFVTSQAEHVATMNRIAAERAADEARLASQRGWREEEFWQGIDSALRTGTVIAILSAAVYVAVGVWSSARNKRDIINVNGIPVSRLAVVNGATLGMAMTATAGKAMAEVERARQPSLPDSLKTYNHAPRIAEARPVAAPNIAVSGPPELPDKPKLPSRILLPELGTPPTPYAVPFGMSLNGPLWFNLPTEIHGLLGGSTNGGKTTAMRAMLETLLNRHTPSSLQVYLIDPKQTGFAPYRGHECVAGLATDAVRWNELLEALEFERLQRQAWLVANNLDQWRQDTGLPYIAVFIDELRNLMLDLPARDMLIKFLAEARSAGISVIAATQYPSSRYVPRDMTVNMPARACFHVPTYVESNVILSQSGAEKLPPLPGRAMVMLDGPPVEVQMPYIERSDKWAWGGVKSPPQPVQPVATTPQPVVDTPLDETTTRRNRILELHAAGWSRNKISLEVFGHKDDGTMSEIRNILSTLGE